MARDKDRKAKLRQKRYKDPKTTVKPNSIQIDDQVLLGRRHTKLKSAYDPRPYHVTEVHGTQIVAQRGRGKSRDSQCWKKVDTEPSQAGLHRDQEETCQEEE